MITDERLYRADARSVSIICEHRAGPCVCSSISRNPKSSGSESSTDFRFPARLRGRPWPGNRHFVCPAISWTPHPIDPSRPRPVRDPAGGRPAHRRRRRKIPDHLPRDEVVRGGRHKQSLTHAGQGLGRARQPRHRVRHTVVPPGGARAFAPDCRLSHLCFEVPGRFSLGHACARMLWLELPSGVGRLARGAA
jgi:hypothetical protein